jgi:hypothetical protein
MIPPFFKLVALVLSLVAGIRAAPSFDTGTWYARGGNLQIPIVMPFYPCGQVGISVHALT